MRSIFTIFRTNNNRRRKPFGISSNLTLNKSLCRVKIRESANREFDRVRLESNVGSSNFYVPGTSSLLLFDRATCSIL